MSAMWPPEPGVYALFFWLDGPLNLAVGWLGVGWLVPGWYVYVGSARGPGGLAARVGRHLRVDKRLRWHVDYLTRHVLPAAVATTVSPTVQECTWVRGLLAVPGVAVPWPGFGSSDCPRCPAHLVYWAHRDPRPLVAVLGEGTELAVLERAAWPPGSSWPPGGSDVGADLSTTHPDTGGSRRAKARPVESSSTRLLARPHGRKCLSRAAHNVQYGRK